MSLWFNGSIPFFGIHHFIPNHRRIEERLCAQYTRQFHCTLSISDSVILSIDRFSLCAMRDRIMLILEMIEIPDL